MKTRLIGLVLGLAATASWAQFLSAAERCAESSTFSGAPTSPGLKELGKSPGIAMGAIVHADKLVDLSMDPSYGEVLAAQYAIITPENDMKWENIHPAMGVYNFSEGDGIVAYARDHGLKVHGHCLLWNLAVPRWVTTGDFTPAQLKDLIKEHITTVVSHFESQFPGEVTTWDVMNEPPVTGEGSFWERVDTPERVTQWVFEWARAACPTCKLLCNLNDLGYPAFADMNYTFVRNLVMKGVPIDGIGLQLHLPDDPPDLDQIVRTMRRYSALRLEVDVTELDMRLRLPVCPKDLERQAVWYGNILKACLAVGTCREFITAGYTDKYSWIPVFFQGFGQALPFDAAYQPKPAYAALRDALTADR